MAKKTDNSRLEEKLKIRQEIIDKIEGVVSVLECYAGKGIIWKELRRRNPSRHIEVLQIEKEKGKNIRALNGDNVKFLAILDLSKYNVIDLDAYGIPAQQIQIVSNSSFSGFVVVTAIQSMQGGVPKEILRANGITDEMTHKIKSIFNTQFIKYLKNFLYLCGVKKIRGYFLPERKNYFYYKQQKDTTLCQKFTNQQEEQGSIRLLR